MINLLFQYIDTKKNGARQLIGRSNGDKFPLPLLPEDMIYEIWQYLDLEDIINVCLFDPHHSNAAVSALSKYYQLSCCLRCFILCFDKFVDFYHRVPIFLQHQDFALLICFINRNRCFSDLLIKYKTLNQNKKIYQSIE